jgi:hypothetical protein
MTKQQLEFLIMLTRTYYHMATLLPEYSIQAERCMFVLKGQMKRYQKKDFGQVILKAA